MKISDESKVGILAAFGLAILILGFSFLKGNSLFSPSFKLYVKYDDIRGLNPSDLVKMNGLTIGRVSKLTQIKPGSRTILVELKLNNGVIVAKNSLAKIESWDLMGTKVVSISYDTLDVIANNGDTLKSKLELGMLESISAEFLPVKVKAEQLMSSVDSAVQVIRGLLQGGQIDSTMNNLKRATGGFAHVATDLDTILREERKSIHSILANVDGITSNLNDNHDKITSLITNLSNFSDSLNKAEISKTLHTLDKTLADVQQIMKKVNTGDGSAAKLINDPKLYDNLTTITAHLDTLLVDLKKRPARYVHFSVFGRKAQNDK